MEKNLKWLLSFFKIGCIGFGGGTSLIPVIEEEAVKNCKLITKEQYDTVVIVGSITPGALTIKISAGIGKIIGGTKGMFLAAACMALPGVVMMLFMLAGMSAADAAIIKQIELISIGITAYILVTLTKYFEGTFKWATKKRKMPRVAIAIALIVFILSAEKSIYKVLGYFGIEGTAYFNISTVHILIMTFFVMGYVGSRIQVSRVIIGCIFCILYALFMSKAGIMNSLIGNDVLCNVLFWILRIVMLILAIWGVLTGKNKKAKIKKFSLKKLIKEEVILFCILIIASMPALLIIPEFLNYLVSGLVSCIISFGGGDAYLTVADGFFVAGGMILESDFYGRLITVVNVLPGSVLGKMLPGVGYYMGYYYGGVTTGIIGAFAGFICSLVGSCAVVLAVQNLFQTLEQLKAFQVLKNWIKVVICGLLGTVILSLIYQCLSVASNYNCNGLIVLIELFGIYALDLWLEKKYKVSTWVIVVISSVFAFGIGNVIM